MQRIILYSALVLLVAGLNLATSHDIVHAKGDHTELCEVFKTDTQSSIDLCSEPLTHPSLSAHRPISTETARIVLYAGMNWLGRAPPINLYFLTF